ncbi:MAG TPA: hypothetical protein VH518_07455 [Tepidisphaeraceae bacterium]|jgi:hypothetical protein
MFDEPSEPQPEKHLAPQARAKEKSDEFRMHAELAAVFEGTRKFDSQIHPTLDPEIARQAQRTIGRLEKSKVEGLPLLPDSAAADAATLLDLHKTKDLSTNDYHLHRRPGEVMILRWIEGEQVDWFYERLQAHFDAALAAHKDDQQHSHGWKQDPDSQAYLDALEKIDLKMADRYLREPIRQHNIFVLSTQSADEFDILHLTDYIMSIPASELVGSASAPGDDPTEQDRAWFFKLFSLRGMKDGTEQMCFFAYLQKAGDSDF